MVVNLYNLRVFKNNNIGTSLPRIEKTPLRMNKAVSTFDNINNKSHRYPSLEKKKLTNILKELHSSKKETILTKVKELMHLEHSNFPQIAVSNKRSSTNSFLIERNAYDDQNISSKNTNQCQPNNPIPFEMNNSASSISKPFQLLTTETFKNYFAEQKTELNDSTVLDGIIKSFLNKETKFDVTINKQDIEGKIFSEMEISYKDFLELLSENKVSLKNKAVTNSIFEELMKESIYKECVGTDSYFNTIKVCIKELINEINIIQNNRGNILLNAFIQLVKESKNKWIKYGRTLFNMIYKLKLDLKNINEAIEIKNSDEELLLKSETFPEKSKKILRKLVSSLNQEKSKRGLLENEINALKSEINFWLVDWERMRNSEKVTNTLKNVRVPRIDTKFIYNEDVEEGIKVLKWNIKRLTMACPTFHSTRSSLRLTNKMKSDIPELDQSIHNNNLDKWKVTSDAEVQVNIETILKERELESFDKNGSMVIFKNI